MNNNITSSTTTKDSDTEIASNVLETKNKEEAQKKQISQEQSEESILNYNVLTGEDSKYYKSKEVTAETIIIKLR
jgi:hypothetical protein